MRALFVLLILFFGVNLSFSQDFDGQNFGDSKKTIILSHQDVDWMTISPVDNEVDTISYKRKYQDKDAIVEFVLIQDQLVAGTFHFGDDSSESLYADFDDIYPLFRKKYDEPDNLFKKKKFQKAVWHIGGKQPYFIELDGGNGMVKVHFYWYQRIEEYNKEVKKLNKSSGKRK